MAHTFDVAHLPHLLSLLAQSLTNAEEELQLQDYEGRDEFRAVIHLASARVGAEALSYEHGVALFEAWSNARRSLSTAHNGSALYFAGFRVQGAALMIVVDTVCDMLPTPDRYRDLHNAIYEYNVAAAADETNPPRLRTPGPLRGTITKRELAALASSRIPEVRALAPFATLITDL